MTVEIIFNYTLFVKLLMLLVFVCAVQNIALGIKGTKKNEYYNTADIYSGFISISIIGVCLIF